MKKIITLLFSSLLLVPIINPVAVSATTDSSIQDTTSYLNSKAILEEELIFYFSKIGHIDGEGNYHLTNIDLLRDRMALSGEKGIAAQHFYEHVVANKTFRNFSYVECVLVEAIPFGGTARTPIEAVSGNESLVDALANFNADLASEIILSEARRLLSSGDFIQLSKIGLAASLATAVVTCNE